MLKSIILFQMSELIIFLKMSIDLSSYLSIYQAKSNLRKKSRLIKTEKRFRMDLNKIPKY